MKICVIGAGVAGCATAYALTREGHEVTLLDARPRPGLEASFANGGQLSYSYVEPFASAATLRALPGLLLDPASPLRLRWRADLAQWRWMLAFLAACTQPRAARGSRALFELAALSRVTLEQWLHTDTRLAFEHRRNGKLVLCATRESLRQQERQVALQAALGARQQVLGFAACVAREPALAQATGYAGGVWTESESVGDARLFCETLARAAQADGARLLMNSPVEGFALQGGRAVAARTRAGDVEAQAFVVCAGIASTALGRALGERLPIQPIKGYSLTLPLQDARRAPTASVTDLKRKMVFARIGDCLRVAAMVEVGHADLHIPQDRVARMAEATQALFPGACARADGEAWAGLRPSTPDSLPIVRPSRVSNVFLNTGHGALGFTLAAGSAARVAGLVASRTAAWARADARASVANQSAGS